MSIELLHTIPNITLFGSRAKGTHRDDSDVDIIIEFVNTDFTDVANSIFNPTNSVIASQKIADVTLLLGKNPITNTLYDIQFVGRYELRNFDKTTLGLYSYLQPSA